MNRFFSETNKWRLPAAALIDSLSEMAIDGARGNEGIVLWLGTGDGTVSTVTHLVKLRGPLITKRPDFIQIGSALFNDVADVAFANGVRLIGQVHSHGPGYSLNLSQTDIVYGLQVPYYLSVVAPDYGLSECSISDCGVHVFLPGRGYVRLTESQIRLAIEVTQNSNLPFLSVGGPE